MAEPFDCNQIARHSSPLENAASIATVTRAIATMLRQAKGYVSRPLQSTQYQSLSIAEASRALDQLAVARQSLDLLRVQIRYALFSIDSRERELVRFAASTAKLLEKGPNMGRQKEVSRSQRQGPRRDRGEVPVGRSKPASDSTALAYIEQLVAGTVDSDQDEHKAASSAQLNSQIFTDSAITSLVADGPPQQKPRAAARTRAMASRRA